MGEKTRFPLCWPEGWTRTLSGLRERSRFRKQTGTGFRSMEEASQFLASELYRLGARNEILSTNVRLRIDGAPYSNLSQPTDPGAAVYFEFKKKPVSLACDKWNRVEDNIWAIACHIEALRGQERWGVGTMDQAFRGYMALPAIGESSASDWWKTLGVPINASAAQVKEAYRILVKKHHPDKGGDPELFNRIQRAMERFEQSVKQAA